MPYLSFFHFRFHGKRTQGVVRRFPLPQQHQTRFV
jgi:hypothetical protein